MSAPLPPLRSVESPDDPAVEALIALYEAVIPASERKPSPAVRAMAGSSAHRIGVIAEGPAVSGFFILWCGGEVAVLEYLVVGAERRGEGLGARLFRAAAAEAGARPLVVEVDTAEPGTPEFEPQSRRVDFYARLGCRRIERFPYILPLDTDPPALELLVAGVEQDTLPASQVAVWLHEIYTDCYGCTADDRRLARMLAALPEAVELARPVPPAG